MAAEIAEKWLHDWAVGDVAQYSDLSPWEKVSVIWVEPDYVWVEFDDGFQLKVDDFRRLRSV